MSGRVTYNPATGRCQWAQYSDSPGRALYKGTVSSLSFTMDSCRSVPQNTIRTTIRDETTPYAYDPADTAQMVRDFKAEFPTISMSGSWRYPGWYEPGNLGNLWCWFDLSATNSGWTYGYGDARGGLEMFVGAARLVRKDSSTKVVRKIKLRVVMVNTISGVDSASFAATTHTHMENNQQTVQAEDFADHGGGAFEIVALSGDPATVAPILEATDVLARIPFSAVNSEAGAAGFSMKQWSYYWPNYGLIGLQGSSNGRVYDIEITKSSFLANWAYNEGRWFGLRINLSDVPESLTHSIPTSRADADAGAMSREIARLEISSTTLTVEGVG
jgi:hypothetical protein